MPLNSSNLARRSFLHYWKHHLVTLLSVALCAAVLTGALMVGHSLRRSLMKQKAERLGPVTHVLFTGERFFTRDLAQRLDATPGIVLPGSVADRGSDVAVHQLQVWMTETNDVADAIAPGEGENETLFDRLNDVGLDGNLLLRVFNPSALPREAVFSSDDDVTVSAPYKRPETFLPIEDLANLSFTASSVPPRNLLLPADSRTAQQLARKLERQTQANILLSDQPFNLTGKLTLTDLEMELEANVSSAPAVYLKSKRIFLGPGAEALIQPGESVAGFTPQPILTYFANELRVPGTTNACPYSMVSANDLLDLAPGEIAINEWLAEDLHVSPGDDIALTYFSLGEGRALSESTNTFRITKILPIKGLAGDSSLTTEFPGFEEAENCRDWDPNVPYDPDKIRDKDEEYWDAYGTTPKAFLSLADGQALWGNPYGNLTAIRLDGAKSTDKPAIQSALESAIDADAFGYVVRDIEREGRAAAKGTLDFGGLFLGMSFFLMLAALVLAGLQTGFAVETRRSELQTLRAIGLGRKPIRRLLLREFLWVIVIGAVIGALLGFLYLHLVLRGINGAWEGLGVKGLLRAHGSEWTQLIPGALIVIALLAGLVWWRIGAQLKRWDKPTTAAAATSSNAKPAAGRGRIAWILAAISGLGVILLLLFRPSNPEALAMHFTLLGLLSFACGLCLLAAVLRGGSARSIGALSRRNLARRPWRALAIAGILAAGCYMVFSTGAFKRTADAAGTGDFALYATATQPIYRDLNTPGGREALRLETLNWDGIRVVSFRSSRGEEASCLNLNAAQQPLILGVDPDDLPLLAERFEIIKGEGWNVLAEPVSAGDPIPVIGDLNALQWSMKTGVGKTIALPSPDGTERELRVAGAVNYTLLQGLLLIGSDAFKTLFPDRGGWQRFLIDVEDMDDAKGTARAETLRTDLMKAMAPLGFEAEPATRRLGALNGVMNAYIDIFQALGGLGVLLGSLGLAIVCIRSLLERRRELATLRAIGFSRPALTRVLAWEQIGLLLAGVLIGSIAGLLAVLPLGAATGQSLVPSHLYAVLIGCQLLGAIAILIGANWWLRRPVVESLRAE